MGVKLTEQEWWHVLTAYLRLRDRGSRFSIDTPEIQELSSTLKELNLPHVAKTDQFRTPSGLLQRVKVFGRLEHGNVRPFKGTHTPVLAKKVWDEFSAMPDYRRSLLAKKHSNND